MVQMQWQLGSDKFREHDLWRKAEEMGFVSAEEERQMRGIEGDRVMFIDT